MVNITQFFVPYHLPFILLSLCFDLTYLHSKGEVYIRAKWPIRPALNSGLWHEATRSISTAPPTYLLVLLDGMPVHRRVTPQH